MSTLEVIGEKALHTYTVNGEPFFFWARCQLAFDHRLTADRDETGNPPWQTFFPRAPHCVSSCARLLGRCRQPSKDRTTKDPVTVEIFCLAFPGFKRRSRGPSWMSSSAWSGLQCWSSTPCPRRRRQQQAYTLFFPTCRGVGLVEPRVLACLGLKELPPWFFERQNFRRRQLGWGLQVQAASFDSISLRGVDLLSLDGQHATLCRAGNVTHRDVKRFVRTARWACKAFQGRAARCGMMIATVGFFAGCKVHNLDPPRLQALGRLQEVAA